MTGEAPGKRLTPDEMGEALEWARHAALFLTTNGQRWLRGLLDHIDYQAAELASCRAGQPRHKDQT